MDFRSVEQVVQRDLFITSFSDIHWKLNNLGSLIHPRLYEALRLLRSSLAANPACTKLLSIWGSVFPGHSLIGNRTTGEHLDSHGIRRGFEAILAGGSFTGGAPYLKDLHARLHLSPGTLLLLDETSQRHRVEEWHGKQRFSHAFSVHRSVFAELELPHTLPDVTLEFIKSTLSSADPPKQVPFTTPTNMIYTTQPPKQTRPSEVARANPKRRRAKN